MDDHVAMPQNVERGAVQQMTVFEVA